MNDEGTPGVTTPTVDSTPSSTGEDRPSLKEYRLLGRLPVVEKLEARIAESLPIHPNILSGLKLFVITPLIWALLQYGGDNEWTPAAGVALFAVFALLDYLDGVVARGRNLTTTFGRFFDRITDYPLLLILAWWCVDVVPVGLLVAKAALDLILVLLYAMGKGSTENRVRTTLSYTTLLALWMLSQGWAPKLIRPDTVVGLLVINIAFSTVVALYNLRILQKRFIADALSLANLTCGGLSMWFAYKGRLELSLLMLLCGAVFDGLDGAAARKWGGTRFGVYSDDIADGVNYGIAPGFALYTTLVGIESVLLGLAYAVFTIGRLVYFTITKDEDDASHFSGAPSTLGGIITLCALYLYADRPLVVGVLVGVACVLMVSFDARYRHFGRTVRPRDALAVAPWVVVGLLFIARWLHVRGLVGSVLIAGVVYGFTPTIRAFIDAIRARAASR